jgi:hypothetical protein
MLPLYNNNIVALLKETPGDQEVIDYLFDQNKKLGEEIRKMREENERLKREFEEYV